MAKIKKANQAAWMITAVLVLLGAYGIGLGIRAVRLRRAEDDPKPKIESTEPIIAEPVVESAEIYEAPIEAVEKEYVIVEEAAVEPEEEPEEEPDDMPEAEPVEYEAQEERGFRGWREVWADLDLTEEERARMRDGFRFAMERWRNMSPEERETETARLRAMGERWENMSEEERREAIERMRDRFEEWRQSDRIELPELSLD